MDVVGDEDGGWAELAPCPYGVQENNRGGKSGEEASSQSLALFCQPQPLCLQLGLEFPSVLMQAHDQVTWMRWYRSHMCVGVCASCSISSCL